MCEILRRSDQIITLPLEINTTQVFKELYDRFEKYAELVKSEPDLSSIQTDVEEMIGLIKKTVKYYYAGCMDEANNAVRDILSVVMNRPSGYFIKELFSYFIDDSSDHERHTWFRARVGSYQSFSKEDMRHIPGDCRRKIGNERYSINGIPCLYIANSVYACWEELNRPQIDSFWVSRYYPIQRINVLNLSLTGNELIKPSEFLKIDEKNTDEYSKLALDYFAIWPLQCACSMIVKDPDRRYREEYLIPQLLMLNIKKMDIDGVLYFSVRVKDVYKNNVSWITKNVAIPAYDIPDKEQYSSKIKSSSKTVFLF